VHATEGTVHLGEAFVLTAAAQGLANLPMEVILTTGGEREPAELGLADVAANVHVAKWIAHSDLLPRLDAMITTGGAGTVLASLSAGVPLIIIPNDWDKPELAQRVVEAGAGLRISPGRCTPRRLRAAVERLLGDVSFRRNAQRMAAVFAGYGGAAAAAGLIEQLVNTGQRSASRPSSRTEPVRSHLDGT
jgi:MGT family glycosyltransferase